MNHKRYIGLCFAAMMGITTPVLADIPLDDGRMLKASATCTFWGEVQVVTDPGVGDLRVHIGLRNTIVGNEWREYAKNAPASPTSTYPHSTTYDFKLQDLEVNAPRNQGDFHLYVFYHFGEIYGGDKWVVDQVTDITNTKVTGVVDTAVSKDVCRIGPPPIRIP